jgi:hypothetical protein
LLITLFAANIPKTASDTALLAPEITFAFLLPHFGHLIDVSIGSPQFGHAEAFGETLLPQPGHTIRAICILLNNVLINQKLDLPLPLHIGQNFFW